MARVIVAGLAVLFGLGFIRLSGMSVELAPLFAVIVVFSAVAAIVGHVRKLLLAIILLELPFPVDVHLFYDQEYGALGAIAGLGISVTTLAIAALYALWLGDILVIRRRGTRPRLFVRAAVPLFTYVILTAASILVARNRAMAFYEVFILVQTLLLFAYLLNTIRSWPQVRFVLSMLVLGLVLESLIMLGLPFVGESISFAFIDARIQEQSGRVAGTFGSPNNAGAYLSVMIALTTGVLLSTERGLLRLAALAGLILGGVAIVLTGSRGAWLGLIVAAGALTLFAWRRRWLPPSVPVAVGMGAVCLAVILQGFLAQRLFPENQSAALGRVPLMRLAGRMIVDKPVLGIGANNFVVRAEDYWRDRTEADWLYVVHNKFLLVASENGLLALTMFVLFLYLTLRYGLQASRGRDRTLAPVALGLTAGMLGHVAHLFVDVFNGRGQVELLWVLAALIAVVYRIHVQRDLEFDDWSEGTVGVEDTSVVRSEGGALTPMRSSVP